MTAGRLEYGWQPRPTRGRLIRRSLAAVALLAVGVWGIRAGLQRLYYLDRDSAHAALAGIPGSRVVNLSGYPDGPTYTLAAAEVSVDGSAARTITFQSPRYGQLRGGSRMCVMTVGPYRVDVEVSDERVLVAGLDFGRDSEFRDVLPFHARDVRELAARYDDVVAFVAREPSGTYTAPDGKVCRYQIRATIGPQLPPWRLR